MFVANGVETLKKRNARILYWFLDAFPKKTKLACKIYFQILCHLIAFNYMDNLSANAIIEPRNSFCLKNHKQSLVNGYESLVGKYLQIMFDK